MGNVYVRMYARLTMIQFANCHHIHTFSMYTSYRKGINHMMEMTRHAVATKNTICQLFKKISMVKYMTDTENMMEANSALSPSSPHRRPYGWEDVHVGVYTTYV